MLVHGKGRPEWHTCAGVEDPSGLEDGDEDDLDVDEEGSDAFSDS